jgi:hypothetical protein
LSERGMIRSGAEKFAPSAGRRAFDKRLSAWFTEIRKQFGFEGSAIKYASVLPLVDRAARSMLPVQQVRARGGLKPVMVRIDLSADHPQSGSALSHLPTLAAGA